MSQSAENQLRTYAQVAVLSDKWDIFRLFAFHRKTSNYSTNIEYARSGQYSNVVEFEFELCHIHKLFTNVCSASRFLYLLPPCRTSNLHLCGHLLLNTKRN